MPMAALIAAVAKEAVAKDAVALVAKQEISEACGARLSECLGSTWEQLDPSTQGFLSKYLLQSSEEIGLSKASDYILPAIEKTPPEFLDGLARSGNTSLFKEYVPLVRGELTGTRLDIAQNKMLGIQGNLTAGREWAEKGCVVRYEQRIDGAKPDHMIEAKKSIPVQEIVETGGQMETVHSKLDPGRHLIENKCQQDLVVDKHLLDQLTAIKEAGHTPILTIPKDAGISLADLQKVKEVCPETRVLRLEASRSEVLAELDSSIKLARRGVDT